MSISTALLSTTTLFALTFGVSGLSCASDDSGPGDEAPPSCEEDTRDETYVAGITAIDTGATDSPDDDVDLDSAMFKFCIEG